MVILMLSPRTDPRFILTAEALVAGGIRAPFELQSRLRETYPFAVVRQRVTEGDDATWYVYRDGTWSSEGLARRVVEPRSRPPAF